MENLPENTLGRMKETGLEVNPENFVTKSTV